MWFWQFVNQNSCVWNLISSPHYNIPLLCYTKLATSLKSNLKSRHLTRIHLSLAVFCFFYPGDSRWQNHLNLSLFSGLFSSLLPMETELAQFEWNRSSNFPFFGRSVAEDRGIRSTALQPLLAHTVVLFFQHIYSLVKRTHYRKKKDNFSIWRFFSFFTSFQTGGKKYPKYTLYFYTQCLFCLFVNAEFSQIHQKLALDNDSFAYLNV